MTRMSVVELHFAFKTVLQRRIKISDLSFAASQTIVFCISDA